MTRIAVYVARSGHHLVALAAGRLADADHPLAAGFGWEEAGLLAARAGAPNLASRYLRSALDTYDRLAATSGATRLRIRANRLGIRAGRPTGRRRPETGWGALTPTEQTVAKLVGQGLTNPQIAGQLFLSPRTIQTHVAHILIKLNSKSRFEIITALS